MKKPGLFGRTCAGLLSVLYVMVTAVNVYAAAPEWPRQINTEGATVIVYQPQPETFKNDVLTARAAVSVTLAGQTDPVFGAVWFKSNVSTDRDARTVDILDVDVPQVKFPNATPEQEQKLAAVLKANLPNTAMTISLDRLMSGLDLAEKEQTAASDIKNVPPQIIFTKIPSVLVSIDGDPKLQMIGDSKLMRVVNTPFSIILDPQAKKYYLKGGDIWYSAAEIKGPWEPETDTPQAVVDAVPAHPHAAADGDQGAVAQKPQHIVIATQPTELIVSDGDPQYTPIDNTNLLFMSNTKSSVIMDINSQLSYVLLSGRWYQGASLNGPWTYVASDALPADFANIPEASPKGDVLAFVSGTTQAKEAVLDASVPQTAAVKRTAGKDLKVTYDGQPKFKDVEGVKASYAVNSPNAVLKIDGRYYCCEKAVWYEAADPMGPWTVCVKVPNAVYELPPSCPIYNVKYVYVYDSTPDVVYVGYLSGYVGSYVSPGGTVVYGTGYYYQPWYDTVYIPYPVTYGYAVGYDPLACAWGFGLGFGAGFALGAWCGGWWGHGWWGPGWNGNYTKNVTNNIYNHNNNNNNNNYSRHHDGHGGDHHGGDHGTMPGQHGGGVQRTRPAEGMKNNVFADKDGNVFRKNDNGWQRRDGNGWADHGRSDNDMQRFNHESFNRDRGDFRSDRFDNFNRGGFDRGGVDRGGFGGRGGGFHGGGRRR
jgi:hypothetical protein